MRTLILLSVFFLCTAAVFSQNLSNRISMQAENITLEKAIKEIEEKTEIFFSYNPEAIHASQTISIHVSNKAVKHVLNNYFLPLGIIYKKVGGHIVLRPLEEGTDTDPNASVSALSYTLSGYLKDQATGEVLIGAHIYEKSSYTGTSSNAYGFYSLTLPAGEHHIVFSFMGYEKQEEKLALSHDMQLNMELRASALTMKEVEIRGGSDEAFFLNKQISEFRFSSQTLSKMPGITGDKDIIKSLQVVPGVETFGDGSSMFFVRGGNDDQNLILIDEVPMYNTSHLFGFLSVISPDAISDIEVFKGDFPVKYGGRLSSVVDIKTKNGNMKRFGFGGNLGAFTSSLSLEGPIIRDKSSFYVSGRVSTLQWLPQIYFQDQDINIGFFDLNVRLNFKMNDKNRLFGTFYIGNDLLERKTTSSIETYGLGWNNILGALRWNHVFSNTLFSNTTVYLTRYQYLMYLSEDRREYWNSEIANLSLKTDFTWYLNPSNTIGAGLKLSSHKLDAGSISLDNEDLIDLHDVPEYHCNEFTFYAGNRQKLFHRLILRYGIRLTVWQNLGPTTVYFFDDNNEVIDTFNAQKNAVYQSFTGPEPRFNITYQLSAISSLKAGYSRTTQFLNELNNSISPFTSLSVWVPSGPNIDPQQADQYSLGYFTGLKGNILTFSGETYYKHYYNYIDYAPHANMLYNPLIEGEVRSGEAWSYGIELMLRKPLGRLTGWMGYTFSRVFVKTPEVNQGRVYRAFHDRPHHFTVFASYDTKKRWSFSANWMMMSGAAITTPVGFYDYNGYVAPIYDEKNNDRLPAYHRLDLSATFNLNRNENSQFRHSLSLNIYNAYGHTNPYFISFNRIEDADGDLVVPADHDQPGYRVTTELSVSEVIPSINYQFKF
ncbi:MAG: TonB-dependent receptor [Bacteroidales bacterium]|nr:TonB-dependent receptor [Bacteroidales bacterium]